MRNKNPSQILESLVPLAIDTLNNLLSEPDPKIRYNAACDILDRTGYTKKDSNQNSGRLIFFSQEVIEEAKTIKDKLNGKKKLSILPPEGEQ